MPFPSGSLPSRVPALEEEVAEGEQRGYEQRLSQGADRVRDGEGPDPGVPDGGHLAWWSRGRHPSRRTSKELSFSSDGVIPT